MKGIGTEDMFGVFSFVLARGCILQRDMITMVTFTEENISLRLAYRFPVESMGDGGKHRAGEVADISTSRSAGSRKRETLA